MVLKVCNSGAEAAAAVTRCRQEQVAKQEWRASGRLVADSWGFVLLYFSCRHFYLGWGLCRRAAPHEHLPPVPRAQVDP